MKYLLLFIILFFISFDIFALDTTEDILLRIELQNTQIINWNSQLYNLHFIQMLTVLFALGWIGGHQR